MREGISVSSVEGGLSSLNRADHRHYQLAQKIRC
jgi:hypothetical protein